MRGPRPRLLALAMLAMAVLVAGCGGGGGGGEDRTANLTPAQILARSQVAAKAVKTYQLALSADLRATVAPGASGQAAGLLRQPVSVKGAGPVKEPNQASLDLAATLGRLPVQINLTTTGGHLYLTVLGQVLEPNVPPATVRSIDVGAIRSGLLGWMTHPVEVDRPQVDGVTTVHLRGGLDTAAASRDVASALGGVGAVAGGGAATARSRAQLASALRGGSVEAWIGTEDLQVRRARATVRARGAIDVLSGVRALDLVVDGGFSKLNEPVTITAPAGARKVDLGQVLGQLGG